jgi:small basic protein
MQRFLTIEANNKVEEYRLSVSENAALDTLCAGLALRLQHDYNIDLWAEADTVMVVVAAMRERSSIAFCRIKNLSGGD